ncbi:MAG: EipA family protein [Chromatiaceae bacterium]
MINRRALITSALAGLALCVGGITQAETPKKVSGTVSIDETQIAFIVGGSFGKGELKFRGKKHAFKIDGISAGANFGASKVSAVGQVYDLKKLADFPGTYVQLQGSITLAGGVGGTVLKNQNGVIMHLQSTSQGLQFNLSSSGVTVKMEP